MRKFKIGDHVACQGYDSQIVIGRIVADDGRAYRIVADDGRICYQYNDGLFRFTDANIIQEGATR